MTDNDEPEPFTTAEVAEVFGVIQATVTRWAREGMLAHERAANGRLRFPLEAVIEFQQKTGHEPAPGKSWSNLRKRQVLTASEAAQALPRASADHHALARTRPHPGLSNPRRSRSRLPRLTRPIPQPL